MSTGSPKLNIALGSGFACGSLVEVAGAPLSGKSSLALSACRDNNNFSGYIDVERRLSRDYIARMPGIDPYLLVISNPHSFEVLEIIDEVCGQVSYGDMPLIVIDSTGATNAQTYITDLNRLAKIRDLVIVLLSQLRESPNSNKYTTLGKASAWCQYRILLEPRGVIMRGYHHMGRAVNMHILKARQSCGKTFIGYYLFNSGWSTHLELVDLAIEYGLARRSGKYLHWHDKTYNGKLAFAEALRGPMLYRGLYNEVEGKCGFRPGKSVSERDRQVQTTDI